MQVFFEIMKGLFFFLTILVGLIFLRGEVILGSEYTTIVRQMIMPGYLILCGIMIGYIIAQITNSTPDTKKYIKPFIIGILV